MSTETPTAYRLPDPFSPGARSATAATPTCCCCCCCCVATVVTAPIVLHNGLRHDMAKAVTKGAAQGNAATAAGYAPPPDGSRLDSGPVLLVLIWFAVVGVAAAAVLGGLLDGQWPVLLFAVVVPALAGTFAVARFSRADRPGLSVLRMVLVMLAFAGEFVGGAYLLLLSGSYLVIGPLAAVIGVMVALKAYRR